MLIRRAIALPLMSVPLLMNALGQNQAVPPQPATQNAASARSDKEQTSVQETNDAFVAAIKLQIKGHEQEPASKVFKNVKWLTDVPATRFLLIMNLGYSHALGVSCTHCHNENDFASDEKRPKRAAREMQVMHKNINDQLSKMENLQPKPNHFINCTTCHRGATDPTKTDR